MKRLIIAALAASAICAAFASEDGAAAEKNWRITVGGFGRGDDRHASVDMSGWYWGVGAVVTF
jgi:hypothetical protein